MEVNIQVHESSLARRVQRFQPCCVKVWISRMVLEEPLAKGGVKESETEWSCQGKIASKWCYLAKSLRSIPSFVAMFPPNGPHHLLCGLSERIFQGVFRKNKKIVQIVQFMLTLAPDGR
jgi:hypothetical protein